jgi:tetratricopeptide (TPR) repeat protein
VNPEFQKWAQVICTIVVVVWAQGLASAQTNVRGNDLLRPPKATLVAVHWPDLTELENDVRAQIKSQQDSLAAAVKNPNATEPELSAAYGQMGQTYHAYSLKTPARECYVNASRLAPRDFRWIYLLAKLDQQDGDVDQAIRGFKMVSSLRPELVAAPVNLGNVYLELNRLDDAQSSFINALEIDKRSAAAYYGLGQVALSKRNYAEAVNNFQKALDLAPGANRIHYSLAMAYRGLGDSEKTKLHLAQQGTVGVRVADPLIDALQELVQGARVHLIRGRLALEAKRYAEAVTEFRQAVAATPDSVTAHVNLGAALTQTGDLNEAVEQFEATLRLDPNNTTAHYNLAVLLVRENKHQQAIVHLQVVSSIDPNDFGAMAMLITLLAASPQYELRDGERALKLAQSLYEATGSLQHGALVALALSELGRCSEAADWQRKLIDTATRQRREDLLTKLKTDLQRYENVRPCRPLEP